MIGPVKNYLRIVRLTLKRRKTVFWGLRTGVKLSRLAQNCQPGFLACTIMAA